MDRAHPVIVATRGLAGPDGQTSSFSERVCELELPRHLKEEIAPLLALLGSLNEQISAFDRRLVQISRSDEVVRRLKKTPASRRCWTT